MAWPRKRYQCGAAVLLSILVLCILKIVVFIYHLNINVSLYSLDLDLGLFETHETWCVRYLEGCGARFGPEKGNYNFTVVTGFLDIGRGKWWKQSRSYREYLTFMLKVLRLDVNLVIFIEEKGENFVRINRRGRENRTVINPISLEQLELYPLLSKIEHVMSTKEFQRNNSNFNHGLCEATYPLYILVTNSKIDLVHRVARENPFNSSYFIWIDGGFGHGETEESGIFPTDGIWSPTHLLDCPDKVTFTALKELPREDEKLENLHKTDTVWIAGGLYGGGSSAMSVYHKLHNKVFLEYLERGKVDDDQTIFLEAFLRNRTNFRPIRGSWYDLMKGYSSVQKS